MYRIKQLREERGLSQRALAQKIGASFKAVNFWENGKVEPSAKYICALSDVFECTCDYLLGRSDDLGNINVMRELSEEEKLLLGLYSKLDSRQSKEVIDFINFLISKI